MSDNEEIRYVTDSSVPNAGRIYDYILGGDYNYEVDRKVADELLKKFPIIKKSMKLVRWFLGKAVDSAFDWGFTQFIDFASGLPTVDHIHTRIPENLKDKVRVLYSDIDPVTVHLGEEIIGDNPFIKYVECDCRKPETLLESDIVKSLFDKYQKFAIGLSGVLYFLPDEHISYIVKILHKWAPKGSIIYFCDNDSENIKDDPELQVALECYKQMKQPLFFRSKTKLQELIKPWTIKEPGIQNLAKWFTVPINIATEENETYGHSMLGGFLEN